MHFLYYFYLPLAAFYLIIFLLKGIPNSDHISVGSSATVQGFLVFSHFVCFYFLFALMEMYIRK